jgi:integrase
MERIRLQKGHLFEKSGQFYIRYYTIVGGVRKQKAEPLCKRDDKHHSKTCKPVRLLRDQFMLKVNAGHGDGQAGVTVRDFWTVTYLPFAEKNLRLSTVDSYKDLWERHLKTHFDGTKLGEYRPATATAFLTKLAERLGRNSLNHVRSLMSGIFSHAAALGQIEHNPMRDAKVLGKLRPPSNTPHYSLGELEDAISGLADDPGAQCVMALSGFLGLRPSEIVGLKWEDCSADAIHIRRAVTRGIVGPTKTLESVASLPMIAPVAVPLGLWHKSSGSPSDGWLFPNRRGAPNEHEGVLQAPNQAKAASEEHPMERTLCRTQDRGYRPNAAYREPDRGQPAAPSSQYGRDHVRVHQVRQNRADRRAEDAGDQNQRQAE